MAPPKVRNASKIEAPVRALVRRSDVTGRVTAPASDRPSSASADQAVMTTGVAGGGRINESPWDVGGVATTDARIAVGGGNAGSAGMGMAAGSPTGTVDALTEIVGIAAAARAGWAERVAVVRVAVRCQPAGTGRLAAMRSS